MRDPNAAGWADQQAAALSAAWEAGGPVPTPGPRVDVEGRPGLVMERIDGPDMLTTLGRQPWRILGLARIPGPTHARLHEVAGPPSPPPPPEPLRDRIETAPPLPDT